MRKLASIQRIWKMDPIEGADRIELANVLGWQCVVNKEGIVIRPTEPVFNERISAALSMKVVSNKYLLKNEG